MALSQRQVLRQSQTIVMTPRLQQAIKLLQLPHLELAEYVQQEIEDNPLLERQDVDPDNVMDSAEPEDPQSSPRNEDGGDSSMSAQDHLPAQDQGPLDVDYDQLYAEDGRSEGPGLAMAAATGGGQSYGDPGRDLEQTLASATNLRDHLLEQLTLAVVDPVDRLIGVYLIDMLDEAGYLTGPLAQIAEQIGCDIARVEAALTVVQQFDPVGIGARDLAECLSLQLRERDRLDPAMQACLAHLDLIAAGDIEGLCEVCGVDAEDVGDMIEEIRALGPKPGLAFGSDVVESAIPDVFVRSRPGGGWLVELNSNTLPRVLVDNGYYATVRRKARSRAEKTHLTDRLNSANWLVKALDQRANTILRVATELVDQQHGFLLHGVEHLRPLNLRDIATEIEMHESTVSRVTANKYIAMPRGTFPMKYYFTNAIASSVGGDSHSAETVRYRMRQLIETEKPGAILSDDQIVEILRGEDVDIARRTVAKYRDAMGIPSSVSRRRKKRNEAKSGRQPAAIFERKAADSALWR